MSYRDATDAVLAVLDREGVKAYTNDVQYEALADGICRAISEHADAEIAALKVRIRELTEWRPMETAPKGRGAILVHCGERKNTYAVCWDSVRETWAVFGGFNVLCEQPTGWLPLPGSEAA